MNRTLASIVAALAIIGLTVWLLPAGQDAADPGQAAPPGDPSVGAPPPEQPTTNAPVGMDDDAFVEPDAPLPGELSKDDEARITAACAAHVDLITAKRGAEASDKIGTLLKNNMTPDEIVAYCTELQALPEDQRLARLDAKLAE